MAVRQLLTRTLRECIWSTKRSFTLRLSANATSWRAAWKKQRITMPRTTSSSTRSKMRTGYSRYRSRGTRRWLKRHLRRHRWSKHTCRMIELGSLILFYCSSRIISRIIPITSNFLHSLLQRWRFLTLLKSNLRLVVTRVSVQVASCQTVTCQISISEWMKTLAAQACTLGKGWRAICRLLPERMRTTQRWNC